jgi:O-acetyl-ADP-ribose deacetylase (regulator of RNase III)
VYKTACDKGELKTGAVLVVKESEGKTIINFPTKAHWKDASKYGYVADGLKALRRKLEEQDLKSVAMPALGCGLGGLKWATVKGLIENELSLIDADIYVYEPQ